MIAENKGLDDLSYTQGDVMVCVCVCQRQVKRPSEANGFDHETGCVAPSL